MDPISYQAKPINEYCVDILEQKAEIFDHEVFLSHLQAPNLPLVIMAGSDHVTRWLIGGASYHFSNEVCLACCNHVLDTQDGVKHLTYSLVLYSVFLDH